MATGRRGEVLKGFRTLFEVGSISGLSDAELLDRSSTAGGATAELAFAALVERHGPMVLRVCRKALGDPHDAHDAFQSTFLVLARKAEAIRDRRSVASFLHGVALRVAASSRAAEARRRRHERKKAEGAPSTSTVTLEEPSEIGAVLHQEVGRLPGRYRDAVVLCYLEGRSCEEAAGHLQLPVGTIKSRLSWARQRLRDRLTKRGLAPAAGAVATILAAESAHAAMALPARWVETTAESALTFAADRVRDGPGTGRRPCLWGDPRHDDEQDQARGRRHTGRPRHGGRADGPAGPSPRDQARARPPVVDGGEARPPDLRPGEAGRRPDDHDARALSWPISTAPRASH